MYLCKCTDVERAFISSDHWLLFNQFSMLLRKHNVRLLFMGYFLVLHVSDKLCFSRRPFSFEGELSGTPLSTRGRHGDNDIDNVFFFSNEIN